MMAGPVYLKPITFKMFPNLFEWKRKNRNLKEDKTLNKSIRKFNKFTERIKIPALCSTNFLKRERATGETRARVEPIPIGNSHSKRSDQSSKNKKGPPEPEAIQNLINFRWLHLASKHSKASQFAMATENPERRADGKKANKNGQFGWKLPRATRASGGLARP